jgi:hypothetical protein
VDIGWNTDGVSIVDVRWNTDVVERSGYKSTDMVSVVDIRWKATGINVVDIRGNTEEVSVVSLRERRVTVGLKFSSLTPR